jgi:hypothetical protein
MKKLIALAVISGGLFLTQRALVYAQASVDNSRVEAALQSLGSRTRAEIARLSRRGADSDRALRFQAEGDKALRLGETVRAAEEYGRAEEAVDTLTREHTTAIDERDRAEREIARAHRAGVSATRAETELDEGNRSLTTGNYADAQLHYEEARADVSVH